VAYVLLSSVPVVGWLLTALVVLLGLGAVLLHVLGPRSEQSEQGPPLRKDEAPAELQQAGAVGS